MQIWHSRGVCEFFIFSGFDDGPVAPRPYCASMVVIVLAVNPDLADCCRLVRIHEYKGVISFYALLKYLEDYLIVNSPCTKYI